MESPLAGNFLTEAELPKGMANTDGDCALGCRSASALQLDARILAGLVALSKDLGHDGSERLNVEPLQPAPQRRSFNCFCGVTQQYLFTTPMYTHKPSRD